MRLTLRTLLSYLDDTLEPADAKLIGQKVAESEQARELMDRIQQVTRRRRLTTPPTSGPGGLDPNTMAEYLDNEVTPDQSAEVEQVCLASDVHLAEVAACHQILTLVLGEPALVPPSAKQRMYGLVKGPESIPFRKPPKPTDNQDLDLSSEITIDQDETLRLGLPLFGRVGSWRNRLLLLGGGVLAACLLVLALVQLLNTPTVTDKNKGIRDEPLAQGAEQPVEKEKEKPKAEVKEEKKLIPEVKAEEKKAEITPVPKDAQPTPIPKTDTPRTFPESLETPETKIATVGVYQPAPAKEPAILAQFRAEKGKGFWQRFDANSAEVTTGRSLVSIPGSRSVVDLKSGVELVLVGTMPETSGAPLFESGIELHANDTLNADLTLKRGRIVLKNQGNSPALVRVRFENPVQGRAESFDVTLLERGSTALVERWSFSNEPYFANPKDPNRTGPMLQINCAALAGSVIVRVGLPTFTLAPPPAAYMLSWNSVSGIQDPRPSPTLPEPFKDNPSLPKELEKVQIEYLKAHEFLARNMQSKQIYDALAEVVTNKASEPAIRRLAVRCFGAMDEIGKLLDLFQDENTPTDVRIACAETFRYWLTLNRDNDYLLLDKMKERYKAVAATKMIELLHMVPQQRLKEPDLYQTLIEDLNNPLLPIRELSAMTLYPLVPEASKISYSATDAEVIRLASRRAWNELLPRGKLPKSMQPKGK